MTKLVFAALAASLMLAACSASARQAAVVDPTPGPMAAQTYAPPEAAPTYAAPASARAAPHRRADAVTCDVTARRTAHGMLIEAHAFADRAIDGEYSLVITKSGGGNSSDISQGGPLTMEAGESVTLGQNEISVERGARVRALLTLHDGNGEICRRSFRL